MGGFSAQVQPNQSSAPAGKGAGMSSMQMGMNPIQVSPEEQLLKTQQLQTEQPNFAQANQIQPNPQSGTQLGGLGGLMGGQITMPQQGGQPKLGMPNAYSNTLQPWDNQSQQSSSMGYQPFKMTGKGA